MPEERKYLPSLGDLIDRLVIDQIKEVKLPDHQDEYSEEIKDIMHDIDIIISQGNVTFNSEMLRAIIIIALYNSYIWVNEANCRKGIKDGNSLELSHALNGVRNRAKNIIQGYIGGRKDYKVDCLAAEFTPWEPSWNERPKK
jgi:hypothetical protein